MKICGAIILALIFAGVAFADEPTTRPGDAIQLFNGKDLSGWTVFTKVGTSTAATRPDNAGELWYVTPDGILHDKGNPFGYIRRDGNYTNFILQVEQRHLDKGNGGVFIALSGDDKIWPKCLEMQGLVGQEGDVRGITNFKITSDSVRTEPRQFRMIGPDSELPVGQWETFRVIVDHGNLTLYINGVLQNQAKSEDDLTGEIALQAEGGAQEFRKVELTPIVSGDGK